MTKRILVLGSGFAGVWAAIGAARRLDELNETPKSVEILVVNRNSFHDIRVRNYERDLSSCRVPLDKILDPVGVRHRCGEVVRINASAHTVDVAESSGETTLAYDRLVVALGSEVLRPDIPGLREFAFDVDTFDGATRLNEHLLELAHEAVHRSQSSTVVVVGAGLTGIEAACEMRTKLDAAWAGVFDPPVFRVILLDNSPKVGSNMGESATPVIQDALVFQKIETIVGVRVVAISKAGVIVDSGEFIAAATVVWCAGMRANPVNASLSLNQDRLGRVTVDEFLRVIGAPDIFAAGDVALARIDGSHLSVMSCQHARPMGRFAGYNIVSDLLGAPMKALHIPWYVTVLDLGPSGAVYTEGWNRLVVASGDTAKATKTVINSQRIYPPLTGKRGDLLAAAAPIVQTQPAASAIVTQ